MGRKRIPDSWCVVKDTESGQLLCVEPTSQPSYFVGTRYEVLGDFQAQLDAKQFIEFKKLAMGCDALAYLQKEHELRGKPDALTTVDMPYLAGLVDKNRESSGRTCFGSCRSLNGEPACFMCYAELPSTWALCATVHVIKGLVADDSQQH